MLTEEYRREIIQKHPDYITKEQMFRICHISKKTCTFLLESGRVPYTDIGKKTHRYKIKTSDVIHYLHTRDDYPELFKAPEGFYKKNGSKKAPSLHAVFSDNDLQRMRQFYRTKLEDEPEVLTAGQIAKFTGYHKNSVVRWCSKNELKNFLIRQQFYIPKEYLLDFLVSKYFIGITVKSTQYVKFNTEFRYL